MMDERVKYKAIKARWEGHRKVSAVDVEWLLRMTESAVTMREARRLGQSGTSDSNLSDLLGKMFGGGA